MRIKRTSDGSVDLRTKKGRAIAERMRNARAARGKKGFSRFFSWLFGG